MEDITFSNNLTLKKDSEMVGRPVSPTIIILASNMTKTTKRKATSEYEPPLKRQRVGNGTDANTNSGQSAPESVDKVLSGHTSREMVDRPVSPIVILASNLTKTTKRKATTENEPPLKRQRVGNTNSSQSAPESVDKVKSSSVKDTVLSGHTSRADFEAKYSECGKLGEGGYGSVYAGHRTTDNLPVAIKHIPNSVVPRQKVKIYGKKCRIPREVLIMHKAAGGPESVGKSAAVSLLDWYDLDDEVVLVMERPVRSMELLQFQRNKGGPMDEDQAKIIMKQLVNAAIDMRAKGVFHRDIKSENILIETCSNGLRVRLIDFGCGRIHKKNSIYNKFAGTSAYVPPEFIISGEYKADPTTVWQLASVLFEMLDGFKQFHITEFIEDKITISSMWSNDCQDLLNKCLELDPLDRATLEEMQQHPWLNNPVESLIPS